MDYQVTFYKLLLGTNGHVRRTVQGIIRVANPTDLDAALAIAKLTFAQQRQYPCWDYCADDTAIEPLTD